MLTGRRTRPLPGAWSAGLTGRPRFEVIPLPGTGEQVLKHLPARATVTVTASPRRGLGPTVELATWLAARGVRAVPHLAARSVRDERELSETLDHLTRAGIDEVFVIGGDRDQPAGALAGGLDLLQAMAAVPHRFTVGIAGYPETHPKISDEVTVQAMADKRAHADYVVSQMCFEPSTLLEWVGQVRGRGIDLPIRIGVAGPASRTHLLRISARVGVGESIRVLGQHSSGLWALAGPGRWTPDPFLAELAPALADPGYGLKGLHIYTFNALAETAQWWEAMTATRSRR